MDSNAPSEQNIPPEADTGLAHSNIWTIAAIAVVAYSLANVLHEGLGHGGACLLVGGHPRTLNAIFFTYDHAQVSSTGARVIAAAGGVVNLMTGAAALGALKITRLRNPALRYFLWLFAAVSMSMAFGYLLFSGVLGLGDWIPVFDGLASIWVIRAGLAIVGGILYFVVAPKLLSSACVEFFDRRTNAAPQVKRLMRLPYLVGGVLFVLAGLPNPEGVKVMLTSAIAASFGGASLLAWHSFAPRELQAPTSRGADFALRFSIPWIAAAIVTVILFVGVLGRGIGY